MNIKKINLKWVRSFIMISPFVMCTSAFLVSCNVNDKNNTNDDNNHTNDGNTSQTVYIGKSEEENFNKNLKVDKDSNSFWLDIVEDQGSFGGNYESVTLKSNSINKLYAGIVENITGTIQELERKGFKNDSGNTVKNYYAEQIVLNKTYSTESDFSDLNTFFSNLKLSNKPHIDYVQETNYIDINGSEIDFIKLFNKMDVSSKITIINKAPEPKKPTPVPPYPPLDNRLENSLSKNSFVDSTKYDRESILNSYFFRIDFLFNPKENITWLNIDNQYNNLPLKINLLSSSAIGSNVADPIENNINSIKANKQSKPINNVSVVKDLNKFQYTIKENSTPKIETKTYEYLFNGNVTTTDNDVKMYLNNQLGIELSNNITSSSNKINLSDPSKLSSFLKKITNFNGTLKNNSYKNTSATILFDNIENLIKNKRINANLIYFVTPISFGSKAKSTEIRIEFDLNKIINDPSQLELPDFTWFLNKLPDGNESTTSIVFKIIINHN